MTPKEQAKQMIEKFNSIEYAITSVNYIISANPHSNPLNSINTYVLSTMDYWMDVLQEIKQYDTKLIKIDNYHYTLKFKKKINYGTTK